MCIRDRPTRVKYNGLIEAVTSNLEILAFEIPTRVKYNGPIEAVTANLEILAFEIPTPVSYTHLDVYKRQPQGGYSGGSFPSNSNSGRGNQGGWGVDIQHERGGGTRVRGEVSRTIESKNGRVRGEVRGHVERTYGGPNDGARSRGIGGRISGSW